MNGAGDFANTVKPGDMALNRELADRFVADPGRLPISFKVDGHPCTGIPAEWNPVAQRRTVNADLIQTVFEGTDPGNGLSLRVECLEYCDYPVVEWTAWFTNAGQTPTPILSDIQALDGVFRGESPVLWHCNGDLWLGPTGYTPRETPMAEGSVLSFAPQGGRPCEGAFPYYRLRFADKGLSLAIGWPGQWSARFTRTADGVQVRAGQEQTHLRLNPGETVRTPRITVLSWTGDEERAVNLWRRWMRVRVMPRVGGRPLPPKQTAAANGGGIEFVEATEQNQIGWIGDFKKRGLRPDVWWIDAGWYPCNNEWWQTGDWRPDPARFPRGLKPVSDAAAAIGADLLIWFEPERAVKGSALDQEHPEWLLKSAVSRDGNRLLNLGNPECRQWLTDHICEVIRDNGIKIYRQDFNMRPLSYWHENDAPERQGITENLHVQGYLQYWDDLLARNPGLWIDSCASGGCRNDMETMRRSVPLHYSDYGYGYPHIKMAFHHVYHSWMPYFHDRALVWDGDETPGWDKRIDPYSFHGGMAPAFNPRVDIRRGDYDWELLHTLIALWRRAADAMVGGDYYALVPPRHDPARWVVRQFDCPDEGWGVLHGIRPAACPEEAVIVVPRGIWADAVYALDNPETGKTAEVAGEALLRDGWRIAVPRRGAAMWFYRKTEK